MTKQRLFEAAMELIGQRGTDGVTVEEIALAAGVAKGTVYYNFGSKNELVEQLLRHGMGLLMDRLGDGPEEAPEDSATRRARSGHAPDSSAAPSSFDPLDEVGRKIRRALGFIADYPAFVRLWLGEQWRADGAWQGLLTDMRGDVLEVIEASVRHVAEVRPLREGLTPGGVAVALFGAAFVTGMDRAAFHPERSLDEAGEAVLCIVRGALEPTGEA
ncbi:helix-turn-helix domain-containing protein [Sinomonas sp. ASV322]|uniref:TetR/AcrR family transcriptional regulator n=1 Tax=Sinomonas sp. ASV322 TaxID=3041920 RepID=UPI0027DD89D4|nr:helix-turn-helix domain-containing protein [Sinomonas sp. ASV322]MDQ4504224.1 helix-turn-helix domain-containing protein [Sinomonas sp. ASV322]